MNARVLPAPGIKYKSLQNKDQVVTPRDGSWNMASIKFHTSRPLGKWTYITIQSGNRGPDPTALDRTVLNFQSFLQKAGINATEFMKGRHPVITIQPGQDVTNRNAIETLFSRMAANPADKPRFLLVVLPYQDTPLYNFVKTAGDVKYGISTVCVIANKFMKDARQDQFFGNVSLKFNLKAGGINQTIDASKLGVVGEGKTMVVGIDVTHPSPGSKATAPSVAGMVASDGPELGHFPGVACIQESQREEMVTAIEHMLRTRLELWRKKNRNLPENLLIYRDGVSEGQYQLVLSKELPLIRNACKLMYPANAPQPKITIVVCGKRHHTRFYPTKEQEADRKSNCFAGTVVDRGITEARNWDFFLQSHACIQGTARTCHYFVILDEIFRKRPVKAPHKTTADALEELTHNMCHLFGRATKSVSLAPPVYYADLLCTRMRCYLSDQFDDDQTSVSGTSSVAGSFTSQITIAENMKDSMFYI